PVAHALVLGVVGQLEVAHVDMLSVVDQDRGGQDVVSRQGSVDPWSAATAVSTNDDRRSLRTGVADHDVSQPPVAPAEEDLTAWFECLGVHALSAGPCLIGTL